MTFHWIGNVGHVSDEDIAAMVTAMREAGAELTRLGVAFHLGRIDPEGTLNIGVQEFLDRARGLGL